MIDIIRCAFTIADANQGFEDVYNIFLGEDALSRRLFTTQTTIELHASNRGKVVAIQCEKEISKQVFGRIFCRRLTGAHHAVDLDLRLELGRGRIDA